MGRKRRLSTVPTPLGYRVFLDRDRWRTIVKHKHPAMTDREREVRSTLEEPTCIRESSKEPEVHMYYRLADAKYVCVVVAPAAGDEYFVVTAYDTTNIKQGKELWRS